MGIAEVVYRAIRRMSPEQRAHWKAKFTEEQWLYLCKGFVL